MRTSPQDAAKRVRYNEQNQFNKFNISLPIQPYEWASTESYTMTFDHKWL